MDESSGSIRIEKLTDTNFHSWKRKIQLLLAYRDLEDYIHEDRPTDPDAQQKWDRGDRKAQAVIGLSLSNEHLEHVSDVSSAKEMWHTILDVFERHTLLNKLAARRKFYTVTMEQGEKVLTYINRVQHLASILKSMKVEIDDKEMAMAVLNGLPARFDSLIVALDALGNEDKDFTLDFVKSRLLQEEQRAGMRDGESSKSKNAALVNNARGQGSNPYATHVCTNCGRTGHSAQRCWGKDVNGRRPSPPQGYRPNRRNENMNRGNKQSAFVGKSCDVDDKPMIDELEFTCLMSKLVKSEATRRSCSWIIDSACTSHMTFDRNAFVSYRPLNDASVEMGTKAQTRVAGRGNVLVMINVNGRTERCFLQDVLHVPEFEYSLISVSAMDNKGIRTTFQNGTCEMMRGNRVVAMGTLQESLYLLNLAAHTKNGTQTMQSPNAHVVHSANVVSLTRWHERLAHVHTSGIQSMVRNNVVNGITLSDTKKEGSRDVCSPCVLGKCHRSSIPRVRSSGRAAGLLDLVHSDVCGPLQVPSLGGARYFVTFIDDHSGWATIFTMHNKSEVFEKYRQFETFSEKHTERRIKVLRTDRGWEYMSNEYNDYLRDKGIVHQLSTVETPEQNGVSERLNRTLMDLVRSMLHAKRIPKEFWAEALATAVYVRNRVTSRAIEKNKTPHHLWRGIPPNLSHLRVFGSKCWYKIPPSRVKKLDERAREAVMIGYADSSKAYKLWDTEMNKVIVSRDVTFDEVTAPDFKNMPNRTSKHFEYDCDPSEEVPLDYVDNVENVAGEHLSGSQQEGIAESGVESAHEQLNVTENAQNDSDLEIDSENDDDSDEISHGKALLPSSPQSSLQVRRSTRARRTPSEWWKSYVSTENIPIALLSNLVPITYSQAISSDDASFWKTGIDVERSAHERHGTWVLVPRSEASNILTSRWIFNVKDLPDGGYKAKARLVARGFQQVQGVDYNETYAPVVKLTSIRILLAIVAHFDLELHQMDVVTAFLNGEMDEDVYMEQPEGCQNTSKPDHVCKLVKALYGTKQGPRMWNVKIDDFLKDLKFRSSTYDPCIYIRYLKGKMLLVALYVDDLLLAGNDLDAILWMKGELNKRFEMKDLGEARMCLGLEISRDRHKKILNVSQAKYTQTILERFGMQDSRSVPTPMVPSGDKHNPLDSIDPDTDVPATDAPYRQAIGALMYLMLGTRPDLAFAVGKLSRFCENPQQKHWNAIKRVFRYICGSKKLGLTFDGNKSLDLVGYSDSDWAGDTRDRKSTSGFVFSMCGTPVSWRSKKQTVVAVSTCEAEYISLSSTSKEAIWLRRLVHDMLCDVNPEELASTVIHSDNQGAIALAQNESINNRNKHIDIAYHYVRDVVRNKLIELKYLATTEMPADALTKPLARTSFTRFVMLVGLKSKGEHTNQSDRGGVLEKDDHFGSMTLEH